QYILCLLFSLTSRDGENPGSRWLSYGESEKQLKDKESFAQTKAVAWGFILFISLISALNIINTSTATFTSGSMRSACSGPSDWTGPASAGCFSGKACTTTCSQPQRMSIVESIDATE
ncbi:hypothetical protein, partial [Paenibacillus zanthoxyli]|uniref:hypothetical protein n=1 Tax=Paenibacillus zanthoxyli TaxID=369399 RepID=UPI001E53942E